MHGDGAGCHGGVPGCLSARSRDSSLLSLPFRTHGVMFMAGYLLKIQVPTVQLKQDEPREKSIPE